MIHGEDGAEEVCTGDTLICLKDLSLPLTMIVERPLISSITPIGNQCPRIAPAVLERLGVPGNWLWRFDRRVCELSSANFSRRSLS